ncbi:MAG: lipoate--protein ligase, partial [Ruminococcaceae bacterium]|nr:lipoate--protein ligase [Oscillospiraceae bacterium]
LGIACTFSGRNDILIEGKKFSGCAYYADEGSFLYHGTVMVNVDLDMLSGALRPSPLKLHSKGIQSVRNRVVNLSQFGMGITPESIQDALIKAFAAEYGTDEPVLRIDRNSMQPSVYEKIKEDDWIYGESPEFDISFERKLSFGNVTVFADISGGKISRAKIYTDSLAAIDFSLCEKTLEGLLFREDTLAAAIESFVENTTE